MENGRRFQHGPEGEEHPGRGEVEVCRPAGARRVERQERGDQGPDGSSRERAAASNEARQMGAKHRGEGEDGDLWDGYPGAAVDGNERSLERCSEVGRLEELKDADGAGLKKDHAEPRCSSNGEGARLPEPRDDAEVQRKQQRHRVEGDATAEVDQGGRREGQDHEPEHEPTPPRCDPEESADPEHEQRGRVDGQRVPNGRGQRHHGGDRKEQCRRDERRC